MPASCRATMVSHRMTLTPLVAELLDDLIRPRQQRRWDHEKRPPVHPGLRWTASSRRGRAGRPAGRLYTNTMGVCMLLDGHGTGAAKRFSQNSAVTPLSPVETSLPILEVSARRDGQTPSAGVEACVTPMPSLVAQRLPSVAKGPESSHRGKMWPTTESGGCSGRARSPSW